MLKRHKVMTCLTLQAPLAKWLRRRTCNAKVTRSTRVRGIFALICFATVQCVHGNSPRGSDSSVLTRVDFRAILDLREAFETWAR